jgi:hypothetical protein
MNRRWIAVAIIVVAIVGFANVFILLFLVPRWSKAASNSPPATAPAAAQPVANAPPVNASPAVAAQAPAAQPANGTVATNVPTRAASHHPVPPAVQAGMRLERQVVTPSGQLRVRYLRDRQQGVREITLQDAKDPANETVLTQYKHNAWVVISPNDDWVVLETREKGDSSVQLFHRVSKSPLKYEVPQDLRASGTQLRDQIWQTYLSDTQQDPNIDRHRVTIDATAWDPDSQKVTLSVSPIPTKDSNAVVPVAWMCLYNVQTKQFEPGQSDVAENAAGDNRGGAADEITGSTASDQSAANNNETADTTAATTSDEANGDLEGERFPATRQQEITVANANELELSDVKYAIFEMFARHGAEMQDAKMKQVFSQMSWYKPKPGFSFDDAEIDFSPIEKHNVAVLRRVREAKLGATHRSPAEHKAIKGEPVQEESNTDRVLRGVIQGVSDALNGGNQ